MENNSILRVKKDRENPYVMLNKNFLDNDPRLSFKAKGILSYLLTKPDNWKVRVSDLIKKANDGKKSIYSGLRELEDCGYLKRVRIYVNGKIDHWESYIYEIPIEQDTEIQDDKENTEDKKQPETLENTLLAQKGKEGETLENTLLTQKVDVEKVDVEKVNVEKVDIQNRHNLVSNDCLEINDSSNYSSLVINDNQSVSKKNRLTDSKNKKQNDELKEIIKRCCLEYFFPTDKIKSRFNPDGSYRENEFFEINEKIHNAVTRAVESIYHQGLNANGVKIPKEKARKVIRYLPFIDIGATIEGIMRKGSDYCTSSLAYIKTCLYNAIVEDEDRCIIGKLRYDNEKNMLNSQIS